MSPFRPLALAAATLTLATAVFAQQADPRDTAIAARQALMTLYAYNLAPLVEMDKGNIAYDATLATAAANNIAALALMDQTAIWLQGADRSYSEASYTMPEIWAEDSYLGGKIKGMMNSSVQMQKTVGEGLEGLQGAVVKINKACNACHEYTIDKPS